MNFNNFNNIFYENILNFFKLANIHPSNLSYVKNEYLRSYTYLQENLNFLVNINLIKIKDNEIILFENSDTDLRKKIIELIFKQPDYGVCIKNYISNFTKDEQGLFSFKPNHLYNIETSSLRNLLISMNYIKNINDAYLIIDDSILTYTTATKFSPEQLKNRLLAQEQLGLSAEKIIFDYEKERLHNLGIKDKPQHVALEDVSAGYDIESYDIIGGVQNSIFIEVKAVSQSNFQFHFSSLEYQTANRLKDLYYIYLLPVDHSQSSSFDINALLKINNIHENIFDNNNWKVSDDGYLISKNKN